MEPRAPESDKIKHGTPTEWTMYDGEYGEVLLRFGETKDVEFVYRASKLIINNSLTTDIPIALAKNGNLFYKVPGDNVFLKINVSDDEGAQFLILLDKERRKAQDERLAKKAAAKAAGVPEQEQDIEIDVKDIPF